MIYDDFMEAYELEMKEKRMLARAGRNSCGSPGYKGKSWVNFGMPKGYMTRKEQERLGGEVIMYNLNDPIREVKSYEEVKNMEFEEGKKYVTELREKFTVKELAKHWGVSAATLYNTLFKKFGAIKKKKAIKKLKKENKPVEIKEETKMEELENYDAPTQEAKEEITPSAPTFSIGLKGEMTPSALIKKLQAIMSLIDEEDETVYEIDVNISETIEK